MLKRTIFWGLCALLLLLSLPAFALAAATPPHSEFPSTQVWVAVVSVFVPLVTYVLNNRVFKFVSEPVRAVVMWVAAAVAGGVTQAINAGNVGFNDQTLQTVIIAVAAAVAAHHALWKSSTIAAKLRGS